MTENMHGNAPAVEGLEVVARYKIDWCGIPFGDDKGPWVAHSDATRLIAGRDAVLAQATSECVGLAKAMWRDFFTNDAPQWECLPDLLGAISQIDNMYAGIRARIAELEQDAARLNWLDRNLAMKIGWNCGVAPAGNISINSIILGKKSIREAIDAARKAAKP